MCKIACALAAFLACVAHGSQLEESTRRWQGNQDDLSKRQAFLAGSNSRRDAQGAFTPLTTLAKLLAAFKPSSSGLHWRVAEVPCFSPRPEVKDRPSHLARRIQMMSISGRSAPKVNPFAKHFARGFTAIAVLLMLMTGSPQALIAEDTIPTVVAASSPVALGSPIVREVIGLLHRYYIYNDLIRSDLDKIYQQIDEKGPLTEEEALRISAALVKQLPDPYSRVLTPEKAKKMDQFDVTGVGINMQVAKNGEVLVGSEPSADSEASRMGVKFRDRVIMINGKSTRGMTSFDILDTIQASGNTVPLKLKTAKGGYERSVTLRKTFAVSNPVKYKLFEDGANKIGYMKLSLFDAQGQERLRRAVSDLEASGASRLVLDLRGNSGGVLNGALGIAGFFMDRPLVLMVTDATGTMQPLYSSERVVSKSAPLQVWIDESTASSAEVLAGALRDNCRATLVGKTTYGKGLIQGVYDLSDGASLIETIASYSTPSGAQIDGSGIRPDIERTFLSDVFGARFVNQDLKAATKIFNRDAALIKACRENQEKHLLWPDYASQTGQWPGTMGSPVANQQSSGINTQPKWQGFDEGIIKQK
mmetsp:Transcript_95288/g.168772  ORF Transcript_95288/g.168772 Transcript_95288/m.168772 type:complete len:589 (-) Transcript_95288:31-1797(-)